MKLEKKTGTANRFICICWHWFSSVSQKCSLKCFCSMQNFHIFRNRSFRHTTNYVSDSVLVLINVFFFGIHYTNYTLISAKHRPFYKHISSKYHSIFLQAQHRYIFFLKTEKFRAIQSMNSSIIFYMQMNE